MANDDTVAACRAALLKVCRVKLLAVGSAERIEMVSLDDAAACLARAIRAAKDWHAGGRSEEYITDAALAAAQGGNDAVS